MGPRAENLLVQCIRQGDADAWSDLIRRYEGRLLAFAESRLGNRQFAEDVVQETFVGFLTSLPNYDDRRPLESYLFSICAHKLTDHMRREGRRPVLPLSSHLSSGSGASQWVGNLRGPSTQVRSVERRELEENAVAATLQEEVRRWQENGSWDRLHCLELLFVRGMGNKEAANKLGISEQQVANFKSDFVGRLRKLIRKQGMSADVFPELYEA